MSNVTKIFERVEMRKHLRITGLVASLLVVTAFALVPASGVVAVDKKTSRSEACGALTVDLSSGLNSVVGMLTALPPDLSKVTGLVGTLTQSAQSLVDLGCLPNPLTAVPAVPLRNAKANRVLPGLPLPGLPVPGLPLPSLPVPGLPLPSLPVDPPGLPGGSDVAPCAAPAADLLSSLFGLVADLLKILGGALPDIGGLLGTVTGLQDTVTGLTSSVGGAPACLPVATPVHR